MLYKHEEARGSWPIVLHLSSPGHSIGLSEYKGTFRCNIDEERSQESIMYVRWDVAINRKIGYAYNEFNKEKGWVV